MTSDNAVYWDCSDITQVMVAMKPAPQTFVLDSFRRNGAPHVQWCPGQTSVH